MKNKFVLSFRRIFKDELLKIQNEDNKKIEQDKKVLVATELNEERVISAAKKYINREEPKRA